MELTRCPQLNDLIRTTEEFQQGYKTEDELKQSLRQMESLYKTMWGAFQRQLSIYDRSQPVWQVSGAIEEQFRALRKGLEEVRSWFGDPRPQHLYDGLDRCREATGELIASFDRLSETEQTLPRHSENPFLNECMRVGRAVADGKLPEAAFKDVLTRMKALQKETAGQVLSLPVATDDDRQLRSKVRRLMERVYAGLKDAEQYFADHRSEHIHKGLDAAQLAMKELYELKQSVEEPPTSDTFRACWRCGKDVPSHEPACSCGFRFPALAEAGGPLPQVVSVRTPPGHTATEVTEQLVAAAEEVRDGGPREAFSALLADIRRRVQQGVDQAGAVSPPALNEVEATTIFQEGETELRGALELMVQGLDRMARYPADDDPTHLSEGLEMVLIANDQLVEMQQVEGDAESHAV